MISKVLHLWEFLEMSNRGVATPEHRHMLAQVPRNPAIARPHFQLVDAGPALPPLVNLRHSHLLLGFPSSLWLQRCTMFCGAMDNPYSNTRLKLRLVWADTNEAQCEQAPKVWAVRLLDHVHWSEPGEGRRGASTRNNCNRYLYPTPGSMLTCCKRAMSQILSLPPSQPGMLAGHMTWPESCGWCVEKEGYESCFM